jgi:hypothetical protein
VKGPVHWQNWALSRAGLYYTTLRPVAAGGQEFAIQYLDFASGRTTALYRKEGRGDFLYLSLTVSPDEKWILFGEAPASQSELMLMENFR